jgi:EpsI family protein
MLRRNLIIGSACLGAAGAAFALTPRRRMSRLGEAQLEQIVPTRVQGWTSRNASGLAPPSTDYGLIAELYDQVIERIYATAAGLEVMVLLAHGSIQTNELQLHRPEGCYAAVGYTLSMDQPTAIAAAPGVALPGRRFVATGQDRQENVVYWTRIGDALPADSAEQRVARLEAAAAGYVCDGLLARFSSADSNAAHSFAALEEFIPTFLAAIEPSHLPAFVGHDIAVAIERAGHQPPIR